MDSLWVFFVFVFFLISVDRTSAAQTQGAHLDTHIWVCTSQAAGNCVSECAIRALGCTISSVVQEASSCRSEANDI